MKLHKTLIDRKRLPTQPMSALTELANAGQIERPTVKYNRVGPDLWGVEMRAGGSLKAVATGRSKVKAKYAAACMILQQLLDTNCPTPLKPRFATRRVCMDAQPGRRAYACECGWYHSARL